MIINSPLSSHKEVLALIDAGAGSFYCGFTPVSRIGKARDLELINRRPDYGANFTSINSLYKAKKKAEKNKASLAVVFNEFYPQSELQKLKPILKDIASMGINKIICADIGLLKYLAETHGNIEITLSIMSAAFNSRAVSLVKEINKNIKKVILPYHLDIQELKEIISAFPGITFETFIFNELCHYEVGLCGFTHSPYRKKHLVSFVKRLPFLDLLCQNIFQNCLPYGLQDKLFKKAHVYPCYLDKNDIKIVARQPKSLSEKERIKERLVSSLDTARMIFGCGACFIPELHKAGIKSLKIGGRNNSLKKKIKNVKFVKSCLEAARAKELNDYKSSCSQDYLKQFPAGNTEKNAFSCGRHCCYNETIKK